MARAAATIPHAPGDRQDAVEHDDVPLTGTAYIALG
jgi:hypothetical protein